MKSFATAAQERVEQYEQMIPFIKDRPTAMQRKVIDAALKNVEENLDNIPPPLKATYTQKVRELRVAFERAENLTQLVRLLMGRDNEIIARSQPRPKDEAA